MTTDEAVRRRVTARACELFGNFVRTCPEQLDANDLDILWRAAIKTAEGEGKK